VTCTRSKKDFNTVLIEAKFKDEHVIPTTVKKRVQKRQTRQTTSKSKIIEIEDKEEDEIKDVGILGRLRREVRSMIKSQEKISKSKSQKSSPR